MRTIGLIGGMSPESTAVYYRLLNQLVRDRLGDLHSAELILHSVDFQPFVDLMTSGQWTEAAQRLARIAARLQHAGADCVLLCTNTLHRGADTIEQAINVPFLHIVDVTAEALCEAGCRKPLLLGTRTTMEHPFYSGRLATHGLELLTPDPADRDTLHSIIFNELCAGRVLASSRAELVRMIEQAKQGGADAVIFGCTELSLILDPGPLPLPAFDSAALHCAAAVRFALAD